jgi:hypothetical protein
MSDLVAAYFSCFSVSSPTRLDTGPFNLRLCLAADGERRRIAKSLSGQISKRALFLFSALQFKSADSQVLLRFSVHSKTCNGREDFDG